MAYRGIADFNVMWKSAIVPGVVIVTGGRAYTVVDRNTLVKVVGGAAKQFMVIDIIKKDTLWDVVVE